MIYVIDDSTKTVKAVRIGSMEMLAARNVYMTRKEAEDALREELKK